MPAPHLDLPQRPSKHRQAGASASPHRAPVPPILLTDQEREVAEYGLGADIYGDRIEVAELKELLLDNKAMHDAHDQFEYVPTNVTTAMDKQNQVGARRHWAARNSPVAVLRRAGEPNDMPNAIAMNRITKAGACHDVTMQSLYERLKTLGAAMKLYAVSHRKVDHFWTERYGGAEPTAIDLWCFRVLQTRHGIFSYDIDQTTSTNKYVAGDLPTVERDIARDSERLEERKPKYWETVRQLEDEGKNFIGEEPMSALATMFTATVADNLTHLDIVDILDIANATAAAQAKGEPLAPEKRVTLSPELRLLFEKVVGDAKIVDIAIQNKGLIAGVHAARKIREATRANMEGRPDTPPPLRIKDAAREADGLVEGAKHLGKPHDWSK